MRSGTAKIAGMPAGPLLAGTGLGGGLTAEESLTALSRGLLAGGAEQPDICLLPAARAREEIALRALLAEGDFDARLHVARALVICEPRLSPRTLARSVAFELATRARQGGVPAFAVVRASGIDSFAARILDLQEIALADDVRSLRAVGRTLARVLSAGRPGTRT
ncbi:MAG TPA: hypothetical protein VFW29_02110 [Solirubrobacteraceae bacterium]|nr:hypothetical protein [Solirubrobacteraceae bacterium]